MPRRRSAASVTLVLLLSACGGGGGGGEGQQAPAESTFAQADLPGIVLQEDQAPDGTSFDQENSGPNTLEQTWQSECCQEEQDATRAAGFQAAHLSIFGGEEGSPFAYVLTAAILFEDPAGAAESIGIAEGWLTGDGQAPELLLGLDAEQASMEAGPIEGLGADAISITMTGTPEDGPERQAIFMFWRVGNASLQARGVGLAEAFGPADVRALADTMHQDLPA